ncbi:unnamed protein product [Owenia fusiformis]|uniref:Uncharacterized protein n=1 Tax=Owenia fusiformis TaxID=6347 RepID=A0A8J1UWS9_OWEFU|nr:unnamed protein product [Owenia fusiformis]
MMIYHVHNHLYIHIFVCFIVGVESQSYRLVDGRADGTSGRVEVFYSGTWGTVCDDKWDVRDALVVCNSLNIPPINPVAHPCSKYGSASGVIQLSRLLCTGSEDALDMCPHYTWGSSAGCGHNEDAGVDCTPTESDADMIRLVGGNAYSGKVQLLHNGVWGTACSSTPWGAEEATVVCNQLGLGSNGAVAYTAGSQAGDPMIWYDNINCDGTEQNIMQCSKWGPRCPPYTASCGHSSDMGVTCDPIPTTTLPTTVETSVETTIDTTIETTIDTTIETTIDTTIETTVDTNIETIVETTVATTADTTVETTVDTTFETTVDTTFETTVDTTFETTVDTTFETTVDTTFETTVDTTFETTVDTTFETTANTTVDTTFETTPSVGKTIGTSKETTIETTIVTTFETITPPPQTTLYTSTNSPVTIPITSSFSNVAFYDVVYFKKEIEKTNAIKTDTIIIVEEQFTDSDKRVSAKAIGAFAMLLLLIAALLIVVSDVKIIYSHLRRMLYNVGVYKRKQQEVKM